MAETDELRDRPAAAKNRLALVATTGTGVNGDPHSVLGKTYSSVQSPLSDDALMDLPLELPQDELERTRKRGLSLTLL